MCQVHFDSRSQWIMIAIATKLLEKRKFMLIWGMRKQSITIWSHKRNRQTVCHTAHLPIISSDAQRFLIDILGVRSCRWFSCCMVWLMFCNVSIGINQLVWVQVIGSIIDDFSVCPESHHRPQIQWKSVCGRAE